MPNRLILLALLIATPLSAQTRHRPAKHDSAPAKRLPLDVEALPADDKVTTASAPSEAPASEPSAGEPLAAGVFTLETPIRDLIADPRAKAVLDRDLPGLSEDPNLAKFEAMSLRQFQPATGGQLTDALLAKTGQDLALLAGSAAGAAPAVAKPHEMIGR